MYMLLFFALGGAAAFALGLHAAAAAPFDAVLGSLSRFGSGGVAELLSACGATGLWVDVAAAVGALLLPGLMCLLLAEAVMSGVRLRRMACAVLFAGALGSFFVVGTGSALLLTLVAVVTSSLMWFATGALLVTPVVAMTGFLAGRLLLASTRHDLESVSDAAALLAPHVPLGGLLEVTLAAVALLPVAAAAFRLLRP